MQKELLQAQIRRCFSDMDIDFDDNDPSVIATIKPFHSSWQPIVVIDDDEEVTVFWGNFTHTHHGCFDEETSHEKRAKIIADDVIEVLSLALNDELEFWSCYFGAGGMRGRGSQSALSKMLLGANGFLWSGKRGQ